MPLPRTSAPTPPTWRVERLDGGPFRARANPPFTYRVTIPDDDRYQGLLAHRS